jgi:glutaminase
MSTDVHTLLPVLYEATIGNNSGHVATYIPQLAEVNPELYGVAFCDLDGTVSGVGDYQQLFCLQSCSKPLSYCLARELHRPDPVTPLEKESESNSVKTVHDHVGYEPSGRAYNEFVLNRAGLPHNPLINAGAIMVASLLCPNAEPADRFATVQTFYRRLAGNYRPIGFNNGVYLSERHHADRNISLAYYMRENRAFAGYPTPSQLQDHLDLYYQCCAVTVSCEIGAVMAATLANRGTCPVNGEEVIDPAVVQDTLSIMYGCGMYDFSGQFGFRVGLPAKSGVSGSIMLVVPNVGGFCIWSPRLDELGNSVRGLAFCHEWTQRTQARYHLFAQTDRFITPTSPTSSTTQNEQNELHHVMYAASQGNLDVLRTIDPEVLAQADYDGRTPLHLACAEGHANVVQYLIENNVPVAPKDRWGSTPEHEATKRLSKLTEPEQQDWNKICAMFASTEI